MFRNLFLFVITAILITGCSDKQKLEKAVLCGVIENSEEKRIIISNSDISDTIFVDPDKKFHHTIQVKKPMYFFLRHGRDLIPVYVKPGDSLNLSAKADDVNGTLKYSGTSIAENNYLLEKSKRDAKEINSLAEHIQSDALDYIKKADSIYQSDVKFLESELNKVACNNEEFLQTEKSKLLYEWADNLVMYESSYLSSSGKDKDMLDKNIQKYLAKVNFNDSVMVDFFEYRTFYESYLNMKAGLITKNFDALADMDYFTNKITILLKTATNQKVKNRLLYSYFMDHIQLFGISGLSDLYTKFMKECTNKKYTESVQKKYEEWNRIEPGNMAPDFLLPDITGKMHSLSEFKGKMIYIDVWATWCAPCRREIPFVHKLFKEYHKKDIVFISISIDESKEAWAQMLRFEKPEWLQLHMEKDKTSLLDDYLISTIPRFILIDKQGKIINAQAPAASGDIRKLFNAAPSGI